MHNYYQWVPYVLVFMGLLFLLPNQLWKYLEEEKIDSIVKGVKDEAKYGRSVTTYILSKASCSNAKDGAQVLKQREIVVENVAKFIVKHNNSRSHLKYAVSFMACQVLNIINVVLNFFLMEIFLDWKFNQLGYSWLKALINRTMILSNVFPRMTLCQWKEIGVGGEVTIILPFRSINIYSQYLQLSGEDRKLLVFAGHKQDN